MASLFGPNGHVTTEPMESSIKAWSRKPLTLIFSWKIVAHILQWWHDIKCLGLLLVFPHYVHINLVFSCGKALGFVTIWEIPFNHYETNCRSYYQGGRSVRTSSGHIGFSMEPLFCLSLHFLLGCLSGYPCKVGRLSRCYERLARREPICSRGDPSL